MTPGTRKYPTILRDGVVLYICCDCRVPTPAALMTHTRQSSTGIGSICLACTRVRNGKRTHVDSRTHRRGRPRGKVYLPPKPARVAPDEDRVVFVGWARGIDEETGMRRVELRR